MSSPLNPATLTAILGPTNTGKTHYAVERMLGRSSGVIGLPLRLLAREVYDRIVAQKGASQCALITGEEKIIPPKARFYVCTVEAMPIEKRFAFLAVDEVQLMANHERGHVFTDRALHARGTEETLLLGAETVRPILQTLLPKIRFEHRERFSTLSYAGQAKLTRLPKRSVIVAFSTQDVYALAELMRRYRGGAAVVMGGLSPRTRNAQAEMFQNGDVDFLIATDAVGMGLNLDTDHVAFAAMRKFDGRRKRFLTPMEAGQIAGRAGRFRNHGTFGMTGDCLPMDDELVRRIENHAFEPLQYVEWRNSDLDFRSIKTLSESLHALRPNKRLRRIKGATDEAALERMMAIPEVTAGLNYPSDVKLLWDVCQIPDFRNLVIDAHLRLLQDIYRLLVTHEGKIPDDFMEKQISRLDDRLGGVEMLSVRLANIRTWTYCANKTSWMGEANNWVNIAREVEDRLSDALHEGLIERFVDRRTRKLLKGMGADSYMNATIKDNGEVWADELLIGQLDGFKFIPSQTGSELEAKTLQTAAELVVAPEIDRQLTSLCGGSHSIFTLSDRGEILWGGKTVGRIAAGGSVFSPDAEIISTELGNQNLKLLATDRMRDFLRSKVTKHLEPLEKLKGLHESETALPETRGFAFVLLENNGAIDRREHLQLIRSLEQNIRQELRSVGVQFGQYNVYLRDMLKPEPARVLSLLIAYGTGGDRKPFIPFAGVTSIPNSGDYASENFSEQALAMAGFKAVGPRIVRFDILNRLGQQIREAQSQSKVSRKFQIMQEMLAIFGCTYEEMQGVLKHMGYQSQIIETAETQATNVEPKTIETAATQTALETPTQTSGSQPIPENETPAAESQPPTTEKAEASIATEGAHKSKKKKNKSKDSQPLNVYLAREERPDGTSVGLPNYEYWYMNYHKPGKNERHGQRQAQGFKKRRTRNNPRRDKSNKENNQKTGSYQAAQPRKRKLANSPFAALAALKTPPSKEANTSESEKPGDDRPEDT